MTRLSNLLAVVAIWTGLATLGAPAHAAAREGEPPTAAQTPAPSITTARPWVVRAEGAMLATQDGSLGPHVEVGITAGRFVLPRLSLEGTLMDGPDRSWSAMAKARWEPLRTADGWHALTLAGGPMVLVGNGVHGTNLLGHAELAYIVRAPGGLTLMVAGGVNIALTDSSYVPPSGGCFLSCPQELHRGDLLPDLRVALGWSF